MNGTLRIPNKELMKEFEKALKDKSFGEVMLMVKNSANMIKATLNKDTDTMKKNIDEIHNSEIPILQYWKPDSLHLLDKFKFLVKFYTLELFMKKVVYIKIIGNYGTRKTFSTNMVQDNRSKYK